MRLINANTLKLETFNDERNLPRYAILSHRWVDDQEVLYKDLVKHRNEQLSGWLKIGLCCSQAISDGLKYVWIDTCCIDKDSSAELSEAINSMFRWYANAHICYAYLPDVTFNDNDQWEQDFIASSWFTRSWTLQELLAPTSMQFYDRTWSKMGLRCSLSEEIAEASGIHLSALTTDKLNLDDWSVAQRMSWASRRMATRVEDVAYSLLGIFDVNMPLLYGEGQKAFGRLQEEIIRQSYDHTIFAWSTSEERYPGMLASSPAAFKNDMDVVKRDFQDPKAYTVTNLGLAIELPLEQWVPGIYWAGINCTKNTHDQLGFWLLADQEQKNSYVRIGLRFPPQSRKDNLGPLGRFLLPRQLQYLRCKQTTVNIANTKVHTQPSHYLLRPNPGPVAELFTSSMIVPAVRQLAHMQSFSHDLRSHTVTADSNAMDYSGLAFFFLRNQTYSASRTLLFRTHVISRQRPSCGLVCLVFIPSDSKYLYALKIGFDRNFHPFCIVAETSHPAKQSQRVSLAAQWDLPDCTHSTDLSDKTFWQCNGFETSGWLEPGEDVLQHPEHMQCGLWALKANRHATSNFVIRVGSGVTHLVTICFESFHADENKYTFALIQQPEDNSLSHEQSRDLDPTRVIKSQAANSSTRSRNQFKEFVQEPVSP